MNKSYLRAIFKSRKGYVKGGSQRNALAKAMKKLTKPERSIFNIFK